MVSRQETARPLLTPGEVMQLPPDDELVMVSGLPPIRAKKARYFEDAEMQARILPPPALTIRQDRHRPRNALRPRRQRLGRTPSSRQRATSRPKTPRTPAFGANPNCRSTKRSCPSRRSPFRNSSPLDDEPDDEVQRQRIMQRTFGTVARQVSLDPGDDMQM